MSNTSKGWFIGIVILLLLFSCFRGCERIDAGKVGIKVNMTGGNQGVSHTEYVTGWCFYWRLQQKVYEFPVYQQHKEYEPYEIPTKGGTIFTVHPMFNYNISPGEVGNMFQRYRVGLETLEETYLKSAMMISIREVTNTFTADSILNNQTGYDAAIVDRLNHQLSPYFLVSQFTANLKPDPRLSDAIIAKSRAIQEAQAKISQIAVTNANNQIEIAVATKDSTIKVKSANAEAEAIMVKQRALQQSPQYIDLIKAEKWNGVLPATMLGSGSNTLFNLK